MPKELGNTFKNTNLVSPLNTSEPKADPGPPINNSPMIRPADTLGFLKGSKTSKKGK